MRAHTMLPAAVRFGLVGVVFGAATFAASEARAAAVCNPDTSSECSRGVAHLASEHKDGLPTTIETPWMPSSGAIQVKAFLEIDPVKNGGPLFSVDMARGAVLDASWGTKGKLTLHPATGATTDGVVKVRHTLTPTVQVKLDVLGLSQTFDFAADSLVAKIPGAKFAYDSSTQKTFQPWGFAGVAAQVDGPALDSSRLFSVGFDVVPGNVTQYVDGTVALNATTRPTFSYKTTKVTLAGAAKPLASAADEAQIAWTDGDYAEVSALVEGEMTVAGTMDVKPYVNVTKVYSFTGLNVSIPVGTVAHTDYATTPIKVSYPNQIVHIPLPNVHAPAAAELDEVAAGKEKDQVVAIQNSGELEAELSFKSEDPQFTVPSGKVKVPAKGKYDMKVTFRPNAAGPAATTITVTSNDPDSPEQIIKITANGADPAKVGKGDGESDASGPLGADGCGCKAAGNRAPAGGLAALGGLALAVAFAARRRSRA